MCVTSRVHWSEKSDWTYAVRPQYTSRPSTLYSWSRCQVMSCTQWVLLMPCTCHILWTLTKIVDILGVLYWIAADQLKGWERQEGEGLTPFSLRPSSGPDMSHSISNLWKYNYAISARFYHFSKLLDRGGSTHVNVYEHDFYITNIFQTTSIWYHLICVWCSSPENIVFFATVHSKSGW